MSVSKPDQPQPQFLAHDGMDGLLTALQSESYTVVGPTVHDGAIQFRELSDSGALPWGITDDQTPGHYRLKQTGGHRCFAWANGPQAIKPLTFAPVEPLWRVRRTDEGLRFEAERPPSRPLAIFGIRACDLAALSIQDGIFLQNATPDPHYATRRENLLLIAVNCTHPAATCFCASTGDGPGAKHGYDLALTELDGGFVVRAGSGKGERILQRLGLAAATGDQVTEAARAVDAAARIQQRTMPSGNLQPVLFSRLDHPRWADVAQRCLSCGNCTLVCPTCFCHAQHDEREAEGESLHLRQWDSCFADGHAWIHGVQIRPEIIHRYRQWLTHKLGSWHEQFGRSGCVGCGRCITWCPVGIDITEEAHAICD
jgi:sulfhydrogenase subunit beta (sulfur reductase)